MASLVSAVVLDLHIGDSVRVRATISEPLFKWGGVTHSSVGVVTRLDDDGDIIVRFSEDDSWRGRQVEMEKGSYELSQ